MGTWRGIAGFIVAGWLNAETFPQQIEELPLSYNEFLSYQASEKTEFALPLPPLIMEPQPFRKETFYERLPNNYQKLISDAVYLQIFGLSFIASLWILPEDISKWSASSIRETGLGQNWLNHVTADPVVDGDQWVVNYIGHPLGGAYYYTLARNNGLDATESSIFTFVISTFYWEYGLEAMFEQPSFQDLVLTPILGPIIGEAFYQLQLKIRANEGKVFGSKRLGNLTMVLLNPEGAMANLFRKFFKSNEDRLEFKLVSNFSSAYVYGNDQTLMMRLNPIVEEYYYGVYLRLKF